MSVNLLCSLLIITIILFLGFRYIIYYFGNLTGCQAVCRIAEVIYFVIIRRCGEKRRPESTQTLREMNMKIRLKQFTRKGLYSLVIVLIYIAGQNIPLPWIGMNPADGSGQQNIFASIRSVLGSSSRITSIFHLGLMPWMTASILMQLVNFTRSRRKRLPNTDMKRFTRLLAVALCVLNAWLDSAGMDFVSLVGGSVTLTRMAVTAVLTMGTVAVIFLSEKNNDNGVGGISLFIFINIVRNTEALLVGKAADVGAGRAAIFGLLGLIAVIAVVFMEDSEFRMPSQKIMIYNEMAENSYFALKFAPIGIQPLMYVMGFYLVPCFLLDVLSRLFPHVAPLRYLSDNMGYSNPVGLTAFCLSYVFVTAALIAVFVSPEEIADEMLRGGECLVGLRPGRTTERYLKKVLTVMGSASTAVILLLLAVPMGLGIAWNVDTRISSLPMSAMILAGIIKSIRQEIVSLRVLDHYKEVF